MKKNIIYMAALTIMAAACSSEDETTLTSPEHSGKGEVKMITETIRATNGDGATRAAIDADAAFSWSAGDQIAVHVNDGKYHTTNALATGGSNSADFTVTYPDANARDAFAIYPASIVDEEATNYGQNDGTLDVTLPSEYTLDQLSGTTTPCPMIATNAAGSGWDFYQLCGLLRLTVSNIPSTAKRLEISFNGKKVCGDFSIAPPATPDESRVIETSADASNDKIVVTNDGTDVALGSTELVLNIPLPVGNYTNIDVTAYDALNEGNKLLVGTLLSYQATRARGVKRATALGNFKITFKDEDSNNVIEGLRFVRIFSSQNKLHNGSTTYGPFTTSSNKNMPNPIVANLVFASNPEDEIVFQVIDKNGKVYSGSMDAPEEGYVSGKIYDVKVAVKAYTFTVETDGKKVYFSPGDLGVNSGVYSFTEPFTTWAHGNTTNYTEAASQPAQRVWFDQYLEGFDPTTVYDVNGTKDWRIPKRSTTSFPNSPYPYEWNNIIHRSNMNSGVNTYYKVTIPDHQYCLLLPPDETVSTDIGDDLTSGNVTNYAKYLGKGFVLLFNTNEATFSARTSKWSWGSTTYAKQGFYWTVYNASNRYYFTWPDSSTPAVEWGSSKMRNHIRLVRDVTISNN